MWDICLLLFLVFWPAQFFGACAFARNNSNLAFNNKRILL
jgi:hypothetical protein